MEETVEATEGLEPEAGWAAHPRRYQAGVVLVVVGAYLVIAPWSVWPWVEPKIAVVASGALLLWSARFRPSVRLAKISTLWVTAYALAVVFSAAPGVGVLGREGHGTGLVLVAVTAAIMVAAGSADRSALDRVPLLISRLGLAVAALEFLAAIPGAPIAFASPQLQAVLLWNGNGSTTGSPLYLTALLAVALACTLSLRERVAPLRFWVTLVVLAAGIGIAAQLSALLLVSVVLLMWWVREHPSPRACIVVVVVTMGIVVALVATKPLEAPANRPGVIADAGSTFSHRLILWRATLTGAVQRPLLGWGPGNTSSAYFRGATPDDASTIERLWGDAHDAFVEITATTGVVGLLAFLAVLAVLVPAAWRASADMTWALTGALVLALMMLYEPLAPQLLPLCVMLAGFAGAPALASGRVHRTSQPLHLAVMGGLCVCVLVAASATAATTLRYLGQRTGDVQTLRAAVVFDPLRGEARAALASALAYRGSQGDGAARAESLKIALSQVNARPWDPTSRIFAARLAHLLGDDDLAIALIEEHLGLFPSDAAWVAAQAEAGSLPQPAGVEPADAQAVLGG